VLGAGVLLVGASACPAAAGARAKTIRWDPGTLTLVARGGYGRMRRLRDGAILCSFEAGGRSWTIRSTDEGRTWKTRVEAARYAFGTAANAETIELADGKVILAYNERPKKERAKDGKHPFAIRTSLSADGGRTWRAHSLVYEADTRWENGCWEPAMVQLPSGELQLYFANESPYRKSAEQEISMARSTDGGKTWTRPRRVSFRRGRRDGMPVPLVLRGGRGIVVAIEDGGLRGRFKPVIVHTTLADNWKGPYVDGTSPRRWGALEAPLPPKVYAGAPYIAQFPGGETVLSVQSTEGRTEPVMVVYVGDERARNFGGRTVPFDVARGKSGKWNSLFVKNERTVTAVSGTTLRGGRGLWAIDGRLVDE
jgi:hypothetical protein